MATYAIGDIQGCMQTLEQLLERIDFRPSRDILWLAGDLVNRGPHSLEVLRWARDLGDRVVAVLGNHDLRLLCLAQGLRAPNERDTLGAVLAAPDRDELLRWLGRLPLVHRAGSHALVHAGVPPTWTTTLALERAAEVSAALIGPRRETFLQRLCTEVPSRLDTITDPIDRLVFYTKTLTYMRVCRADDELFLDFTGPPSAAPAGYLPWFAHANRRNTDVTWVCGHWSALGLHTQNNIRAIDTGCVWGQGLTAYCLEDGRIIQQPVS